MRSICKLLYPLFVIVISLVTFFVFINQESYYGQFINLVGFVFMVVLTLVMQCLTNDLRSFWKAIKIAISGEKADVHLKKSVDNTMLYWMFSGLLYSLVFLIDVMQTSPLELMYMNISMGLNTILYGVLGIVILFPYDILLRKQQESN